MAWEPILSNTNVPYDHLNAVGSLFNAHCKSAYMSSLLLVHYQTLLIILSLLEISV